MEDSQVEAGIALETSPSDVFIPPSIHHDTLLSGASYSYFSLVPPSLLPPSILESESVEGETKVPGPPCALGIDEAGRGPVLGPMVYGAFYLPLALSTSLLSKTHHFDDSKVLTPAFRSQLMKTLCTTQTNPSPSMSPDPRSLYSNCGWAVEVMSARDISANMLKPFGTYNLNAQAMDATISLIQRIYGLGVNIQEIYIDTIGQPAAYQKKLERVFPTAKITVAKKADSLYPCVSAASVCAKVTRDVGLDVLYSAYESNIARAEGNVEMDVDVDTTTAISHSSPTQKIKALAEAEASWGSGYPSDARCTSWLKRNMHPIFGWGPECRFSWGTAKDLLESKGSSVATGGNHRSGPAVVIWPSNEDEENTRVTDFFTSAEGECREGGKAGVNELTGWFGVNVSNELF